MTASAASANDFTTSWC